MSVKTIFKVLIGTMVVLVLSCLAVELFNISVSGLQLKQACVMAANQAAELYTQETYKQKNINGEYEAYSIALPSVKTIDGTNYVTGSFYPGTDTASIWSGLYGNNANFKGFCNMTDTYTFNNTVYTYKDTSVHGATGFSEFAGHGDGSPNGKIRDTYTYLNRLYMGVTNPGVLQTDTYYTKEISYDEFSDNVPRVRSIAAAKSALLMVDDMYTPVNIGIPYFDEETINKMFRWNLAQILTNTLSDSIREDPENPGQYFVAYKGFRCYVQDAYISNLDYYIFDTTNASDRIELQRLTGLTVKGSTASSGQGINTANIESPWGAGNNEDKTNQYICVVGIKYKIPITYEGVTPLKSIFSYAFKSEANGNTVEGYNAGIQGNNGVSVTHTNNNRADYQEYTYQIQDMSNDGSESMGGLVSTTGELYYVLVR